MVEKKQPPPMANELYQRFQKSYHDAKECEKGLRTQRGYERRPIGGS